MVLRKMGPHPEDWIPKTDLEIVEEVLRDQNKSRAITFLSSIGVSSASKRSTVSARRIRELEDKILMRHGVDVDHRPVGNPKRKV
jgi:hypothetical protein